MSILEKAKRDGAKIFLTTSFNMGMSGKRDLQVLDGQFADEKILAIGTGKLVQMSNDRGRGLGRTFGKQQTGTDSKGVLVVGEHQAVFADKRMFGSQITTIHGNEINAINVATGMMSAKLTINCQGVRYDISDLKKDCAAALKSALEITKKNSHNSRGGGTTNVVNQKSVAEHIKELKSLHEQGILDDEEYKEAKAKLLAKM